MVDRGWKEALKIISFIEDERLQGPIGNDDILRQRAPKSGVYNAQCIPLAPYTRSAMSKSPVTCHGVPSLSSRPIYRVLIILFH